MLIKLKVLTNKSFIMYKPRVTYVDSDRTIKEYISNITKLNDGINMNFDDVYSVESEWSFNCKDNFAIDSLEFIKFVEIEKSYGKIKHEVESNTVVVLSEKSDDQPQRTLMDFVTETCHVPKLNRPEKQESYEWFLNDKFPSPDSITSLLMPERSNSLIRGNMLLFHVDYLRQKREIMSVSREVENEQVYEKDTLQKYRMKRDVEGIIDLINDADYCEPFNIENCLPDNCSYRYSFTQNPK